MIHDYTTYTYFLSYIYSEIVLVDNNREICCFLDGKSETELNDSPANTFVQSRKFTLKGWQNCQNSVVQPFWNDIYHKLIHPWHCQTALSGCSYIVVRSYNKWKTPNTCIWTDACQMKFNLSINLVISRLVSKLFDQGASLNPHLESTNWGGWKPANMSIIYNHLSLQGRAGADPSQRLEFAIVHIRRWLAWVDVWFKHKTFTQEAEVPCERKSKLIYLKFFK